jgi:hypothetical protein
MEDLKLGDIVRVNRSFIGSTPNCLAYVYEEYTDFDDSSKHGVSIITEDGINIGGFSYEEQKLYLEFVKESGIDYKFENVIQMDRDFDKTMLNKIFYNCGKCRNKTYSRLRKI